jgi:hypothetical protein
MPSDGIAKRPEDDEAEQLASEQHIEHAPS